MGKAEATDKQFTRSLIHMKLFLMFLLNADSKLKTMQHIKKKKVSKMV